MKALPNVVLLFAVFVDRNIDFQKSCRRKFLVDESSYQIEVSKEHLAWHSRRVERGIGLDRLLAVFERRRDPVLESATCGGRVFVAPQFGL